jgi:dephospho-CoA kinase
MHLPYIVKEAALIFETILYQKLDKVIHVSAPEDLRIARVMLRDACSKEEVLNRIARQMNEEEKLKRADFVLYNDEIHPLLPQVVSLHQQIMQLV